ncbi:ROK family transcriptional regulator [Kribbella sp. NPDC050470]|uniref:ROK family transcriptional regulator n=1 Tax=unclassified Kribbella TaxID=2644121 RepID=UPI0037B76E81
MNKLEKTATSPLLRRMNAAAVLDVLRTGGPATGTELMEVTGLSRPTVHTVCDHLIEMGWIDEIESRRSGDPSSPGRRARQYQFNARAGYVVGIDMGQNKATAVVTDLRGDIVAEDTRGFAHDLGADDRIREARQAMASALDSAEVSAAGVLAMALAVPGPVGPDGHIIASADTEYLPGLGEVELDQAVGEGFGCPVLVENDANLAVLGERWHGAAAGVDDVIELLAGERLGAGLFLGGNLIRGSAGGAGELKALSMVEGVGNTDGIGFLAREFGAEVVASARGPRSKVGRSALYAAAGGDPAAVTAQLVFEAARTGDAVALEVVDRVVTRIARVLALLHTMLNPELIVVGGAVADAGDLLVPGLETHLTTLVDSPPRLAASTLGARAVVIGAVRRALDHAERALFTDPAPTTRRTAS